MSRECPRPRDGGQRYDQRQAPAEPCLPRAVTPVLLPARAVLHVDVVRAGPVDAVPRQQIFFQSIYSSKFQYIFANESRKSFRIALFPIYICHSIAF